MDFGGLRIVRSSIISFYVSKVVVGSSRQVISEVGAALCELLVGLCRF